MLFYALFNRILRWVLINYTYLDWGGVCVCNGKDIDGVKMNFKDIIDVLDSETVLEIKIYASFQIAPICEGNAEVSKFKNDPDYTEYLGEILKVRFIRHKPETLYVVFDKISQVSFEEWKNKLVLKG